MFVFIKIFINPNHKIKLSNFDPLNALSLIIKYINNNVVANYNRFSDGKSQQSKLMVTTNIFFGDTLWGRKNRATSFVTDLLSNLKSFAGVNSAFTYEGFIEIVFRLFFTSKYIKIIYFFIF